MTETAEFTGRVAVIIPTYNERDNIRLITAGVRSAVPAADLLIVDDNSPDGTGKIADDLAAEDKRIHVPHRLANVDRTHGTSKMSNAIVCEALWRVTQWGITGRLRRHRARMTASSRLSADT